MMIMKTLSEHFQEISYHYSESIIVPILCKHPLDATSIDDRALSISPILI